MKRLTGLIAGVLLLASCGGGIPAYAGSKSGVDGTLDVSVVGTLPVSGPIAVTGTFWQTTQPVSAASLPLPTGAATSALQTTINTTLGSPMQATGGTVGLVAGTAAIGSVWTKPPGAALTATSGNIANGTAQACFNSASGVTVYLTGVQITASGATAASVVNATVTGTSGNLNFAFAFPAGVTTQATPLILTFDTPIPASGPNVAMCVTLPAGGAGNTNSAVNLTGFQY